MLDFLESSTARRPLDYSECASVIRQAAARLDVSHRSTGLSWGSSPAESLESTSLSSSCIIYLRSPVLRMSSQLAVRVKEKMQDYKWFFHFPYKAP